MSRGAPQLVKRHHATLDPSALLPKEVDIDTADTAGPPVKKGRPFLCAAVFKSTECSRKFDRLPHWRVVVNDDNNRLSGALVKRGHFAADLPDQIW
jgi:hypothetical protein